MNLRPRLPLVFGVIYFYLRALFTQKASSSFLSLAALGLNRGTGAQQLYSGLVAPGHVKSSWTRDRTHVPRNSR